MNWNIIDLFRRKGNCPDLLSTHNEHITTTEEAPAAIMQEVCETVEQSAQQGNEQLLKLFEKEHIRLSMETSALIKAQTRAVEPERISADEWKKIRYLCILDVGFNGCLNDERLPIGYYLSHDGSWLIGHEYTADLNAFLKQCGNNLVFLRFEMPLEAPLDLRSMNQLRYLRLGTTFVKRKGVM